MVGANLSATLSLKWQSPASWEPIDVAMDCLRERFVDHYGEPASWDYSIWLGLTDMSWRVAEALRVG